MYITGLTPEYIIAKQISSTFDSVNLINELSLILNPTQYDIDATNRNKSHLVIMMTKSDFIESLTAEQIILINSAI
jgi:hypothetical protein